MDQTRLTLVISAVYLLFYNLTFFKRVLAVYPLNGNYILFLLSLTFILFLAINLFLSLLRIKAILKVFFSGYFLISTLAAYVMDSYGVVTDENMLLNVIKTNSSEAFDLVTPKLFLYLFFLFVVPVYLLSRVQIIEHSKLRELKLRLISIGASLGGIFILVLIFSKSYASFLREHKPLRYYTNPTYYTYTVIKFSTDLLHRPQRIMESFGRDALIPSHDVERELVIMVVGETARKDHFSLNGYSKETNPRLKKEEHLVSFKNVTSCGTSTAVSVPCLFSHFGRSAFDKERANFTENLLDVLVHTKEVNVLWRDNNSDSKGVALRVPYEDFKTSSKNTICNPECRDEGMLVGLQEHINSVREKDIMIVLHQMGNHGPAYYKRYPPEFEVFKPVCKTSELSNCTKEEIQNAYDNAILYTDYFLSKVIELLKHNSQKFNTAMVYVSDHGESLGENGVYLHSMPYMIAPAAQTEVPMIMWFGGPLQNHTDYVKLRKISEQPYSHDNIFHTILGLMEIESSVYNQKMDILHGVQLHDVDMK